MTVWYEQKDVNSYSIDSSASAGPIAVRYSYWMTTGEGTLTDKPGQGRTGRAEA